MAQPGVSSPEPTNSPAAASTSFLRKLFGRTHNGTSEQPDVPQEHEPDSDDLQRPGLIRRVSRKVVPGLPRVQTFKRQQSERRDNLAPVEPSPAERRAASVDRRVVSTRTTSQTQSFPRTSAPDILEQSYEAAPPVPSVPGSPIHEQPDERQEAAVDTDEKHEADEHDSRDEVSTADAQSITTSQYDAAIHEELERTWILNLSMHFRDKSKREKFFVTYRERDTLWRRVTISLDYRNAPENSLELDLLQTQFQRDKSAKIYEAIRESLVDIQFYDTVTNLKLQTTDGRLHVHVVEDVNEVIRFPTVRQVQHLGCRRVRERDIKFDSHMSGFVYKVEVSGEVLIKKEIPGPETIDEFLYEINALNRLRYSRNVIQFYGVIVDDQDEYVKGLLISYADQGALIDVIYDHRQDSELGIPWPRRQKWARQIVQGLSDIHESGFVQGDFTLSNIVIDEHGDAKIIDINRRGCPVGWEPPEATPLIESNQRISMYIGVKSDIYQLGMVLWALATQDDDPEAQGRPLLLPPDAIVPSWYRQMVEICLSEDPRQRMQASSLLGMFPPIVDADEAARDAPTSISVDDGYSLQEYFVDEYQPNGLHPRIRTVQPPSNDWSYVNLGHHFGDPPMGYPQDPYYYTRGRSPPSPRSSNYGRCESPHLAHGMGAWAEARNIAPSYSDVDNGPSNSDRGGDAIRQSQTATPTTSKDSAAEPLSVPVDHAGPGQHSLGVQMLEPVPNDLCLSEAANAEVECQPTSNAEAEVAKTELAEVLAKPPQEQLSDTATAKRPDTTSPITIRNFPVEENGEAKQLDDAELRETGATVPETETDMGGKEAAGDTTATAHPEKVQHQNTDHQVETGIESDLVPAMEEKINPPHPAASPTRNSDSPIGDLPDSLKGVGSAHLESDEYMMREKACLDEDFGFITTAAPLTTDSHN